MNCREINEHGKSGTYIANCFAKKILSVFYVLIACIIFISMFACANAKKNSGTPSTGSASNQQQANSSSQNNPAAGSNVNSNTQAQTTPNTQPASPTVTTPTPPAPTAPVQQPT
ncbi:MAG: hypothetical protein ABSF74_06030, partial [Dehalococcoidia bacterium]